MNSQGNGRRAAPDGIVIAGGGLAAQRCAETLRRAGSDEPIRLLCAERHRPYDRPPLSKELLAGGCEPADLSFRDAPWYETHAVDLLSGVSATRLVTSEHRVETSDGGVLRYRRLLIATGGRPRTLPALAGYENVLTLRTLDDALDLRSRLDADTRLVIVGAGFVGLEIAAAARAIGAEVTVIEAATTPLASVLGEYVGSWFAELHRGHGVRLLTAHTVMGVETAGAAVTALQLSDSFTVAADLVVVGVGIDPNVGWLADSGLDLRGGVRVDQHGRTPCPDVFACGDAAATFDVGCGIHIPGSHWEAAARQAAGAARLMVGLEPRPLPAASFWTDQYGLRIHYVGRSLPGDAVAVDGEPAANNFRATYSRTGRVVAVLLVDRPRSLPEARALIERGYP
ncbi:MAG: FAD-dependent oxidoreductase [Acidobacteriota bacterium]|nr:FAD-dependent oxidoreductase [Acidobacteriota bacterium]